MEFWINLIGFVGIAILAVPTMAVNRRKKRLDRIERLLIGGDDGPGLRRVARRLREERARRATRWHRMDELCLYLGYACLFASTLMRLVLAQ
ncbi:hypothetical protein [Roseitranquillus sediminis]|uniref:hypothetical protein n=1 Tax=Roseitranquillus sediminis TaxID=2809051 RepID=UPI001D0C2DFB|nr:hypothetical protein [Roseitranquillus sediminis]MBM9593300.1 hypothetical protein [Roseitranquillus sediminis]